MKRIAVGLSVVFVGFAASDAYAASPLPAAQWYSDAHAGQNSVVNDHQSFAPGANTSSASDAGGTSSVTINSVAAPNPNLLAQASSSTPVWPFYGTSGAAGGHGQLNYSVEVVDPTGAASGTLIPINVTAYGYASSTSSATASANLSLSFYGSGASSPQSFQAISNNGAPTSYINVNNSYQAVIGQQVLVWMQTDVNAASAASPFGGPQDPYNAASAYVDPYFSLPQWAIDDGYQIELSAGIGNAPVGAPGPTPGLGLVGLVFLVLASFVARARGFLAH